MINDKIRKTIEFFSYLNGDEITNTFKNHVYFRKKDKGSVKALRGKVDLMVLFVNDENSKWSRTVMEKAMNKYESAARILNLNAACRGVDLKLKCVFKEVTLPMICMRENKSQWYKLVADSFKRKTLWGYQSYYKKTNSCDEAPIIFNFNKPFRAYAVNSEKGVRSDEFSVIDCDVDETLIIHELLHQFGAVDLYYPSYMEPLLMVLNYNSVMAGDSWLYIDSLTSYLIGWTDCINKKAATILEKTKDITEKAFDDEIRKQWQKPGK